jgi:hypothetical protein
MYLNLNSVYWLGAQSWKFLLKLKQLISLHVVDTNIALGLLNLSPVLLSGESWKRLLKLKQLISHHKGLISLLPPGLGI